TQSKDVKSSRETCSSFFTEFLESGTAKKRPKTCARWPRRTSPAWTRARVEETQTEFGLIAYCIAQEIPMQFGTCLKLFPPRSPRGDGRVRAKVAKGIVRGGSSGNEESGQNPFGAMLELPQAIRIRQRGLG